MSGRGVIANAAMALGALAAGCGSALSAPGGGTGDAAPDPGLSPREAVVAAQWKGPRAVVLEGRGSDTPRSHVALSIMDDDPPLLDRPASHLRAVLGRARTVLHHGTTWRYRVSVRARLVRRVMRAVLHRRGPQRPRRRLRDRPGVLHRR